MMQNFSSRSPWPNRMQRAQLEYQCRICKNMQKILVCNMHSMSGQVGRPGVAAGAQVTQSR